MSTSEELEGAAIWDANGELIFPDRKSIKQISEDKVLHEVSRFRILLKAAKLIAWDLRNVEATSLLYCSVNAVSVLPALNASALRQPVWNL